MIVNPLSSDLNAMRQTLLFSGLEVIAYNLNRQSSNLKLFEMGNVYKFAPAENSENPSNDLKSYREEMHLSIFIAGKGTQYWRNSTTSGDFFALKGCLELLFRRFAIDIYSLQYGNAPADLFSEGICYSVGGKVLAMTGTVSPARRKQFDIKMPVFAAEVNWNLLLKLYSKNKVLYRELPKYPEVKRDLALVINENVSFAEIRKAAFSAERKILKQVSLFDVYRGDKISAGKKQYAISFVLQDNERTLTDKYVESVMNKIFNSLQHKLGAALR